jgi:hypothetical protein
VRMEAWRQWPLGGRKKLCSIKPAKNRLDSDRPSHGRRFRSERDCECNRDVTPTDEVVYLLNSRAMIQGRSVVAFRWLLPMAQLVVCLVALWPFGSFLIYEISESIHAYRQTKTSSPSPSVIQQLPALQIELNPEDLRTVEALDRRECLPMMVNLPSGLVQIPYAILNPEKQLWLPRAMQFKVWCAISWPMIGIVFWWSAGRGIDALLAVRRDLILPRMSWFEMIAGLALSVFCGVAAVCMPIYGGVDKDFPLGLWLLGSGLWTVLGAVVVVAWTAQRRMRRRLRLSDSSPEASPV